MSKADELAERMCSVCPKMNECMLICNQVMMPLWADTRLSPHDMNEQIKTAREKIRFKEKKYEQP
jgi:hypothetical protein